MIEEDLQFEDKGRKHVWTIIHNLDEFNENLLDYFYLFGEHFPNIITSKNEFCMFVMVNGKQKHPEIKCFPKDAIEDVMRKFN